MDLFLKGKVVIVTGGGSGIGAAVTQLLAEEGAVPLIVTNAQPEQGFMDRLKQIAPKSELIIADLCQEAECAGAVGQVLARFGRIDALVNNAGVNDGVGLEAGREAFLGSLEKNLIHYYQMAHLCREALEAARGLSSISPRKPRSAARAAPAAIPRRKGRCWH